MLQKIGLFATEESLKAQLAEINSKIEGLSARDFKPRKVYITFNLEQGQRRCLKEMAVGKLEIWSNTTQNQKAVFKGKVLHVTEPVEPSEVIWENLNVKALERLIRYCVALAFAGVLLFVSFLVIRELNGKGGVAAIFISLLNVMLPQVMKVCEQVLFLVIHGFEGLIVLDSDCEI